MVVLSASLQKAGSGWYYNLTSDLLVAAGYLPATEVRDRYRLHGMLEGKNCRIGRITPVKLLRLAPPHWRGHRFAVKTHRGPNRTVEWGMRLGIFRPTYIYRDPRDVVVSAVDHGRRIREKGLNHTFAKLDSVETATVYVRQWLAIWQQWAESGQALMVRYEDLSADPMAEMRRLADHLEVEVPEAALAEIVARYSREKLRAAPAGHTVHFNKGETQRWRRALSAAQQAAVSDAFADFLPQMGYA
jgi:hypothetical protein